MTPRVWILLGPHRGDNNQLRYLGQALGWPVEEKPLAYKPYWRSWQRIGSSQPWLLTRDSRALLRPPWPDLVIGVGRRSVPVARWLRRKCGAKLVRLGNPRMDPARFDLVLTTAQYPVPDAPSVIRLPLAIAPASSPGPSADELAFLAGLPRPLLLLSIGGTTRYWQIDEPTLARSARTLAARAAASGGTLLAVTSPRTPPSAIAAVRAALAGQPSARLLTELPIRFPVLLAAADENHVTADSVSMLSEAVAAGKPVGIIPVEPDPSAANELLASRYPEGLRDLRRFWTSLEQLGLAGSIDQPRQGNFDHPLDTAVAAIRRIMAAP